MSEPASFDDRVARRFIRIGGLLFVICVAALLAGSMMTTRLSGGSLGTVAIRVFGVLLSGFGLGFGLISGLLVVTGLLQRFFTRLGRAGSFVVALIVVAAVVLFALTPICWDQKSVDCRSIVERVSTILGRR